MTDELMSEIKAPKTDGSIIMVVGVGGAGGNAVNHMWNLGIRGVTFMVCNTDQQALDKSPVELKIRLGAEAYLQLHGALIQRLLVGIANHERHAPYTQVPHMVHGIPAGTADTDHHNDRPVRFRGFDFRHQFVCHISLLLSSN